MNLSSIRRLMPILAVALAISPVFATPAPSQSQYDLGVAAYDRQDYATAYRLWRSQADQGHADAQTSLGVMYGAGQGVPQDYAEAMLWYRLAAAQGNATAQYNLGVMYSAGQGVPQDYVQAHKWFNLAASRLPATEAENRDMATKNRDTVAAKMTPQQIAEAQRLAREWKPK